MKKLKETTVFEGKWLFVQEHQYLNKHGKEFTWEVVNRKRSSVGVVVVARLVPSDKYILIKQFRPAINGYILSFPAGLGFDDPNQALIELKEETGYSGRIIDVSPILKTGASLINDSARIIRVEVDERDSQNINPKQQLETAEDIEVCLVSKSEGRNFLGVEQDKGVHIAANLWYVFGFNH